MQRYVSKAEKFSSVGDRIKVKWVLDDCPVWWPATVVSIHSIDRRKRICSGELLYQPLKQYPSVRTLVVFSTSSVYERLVNTSTDGCVTISEQNNAESCSWVYANEPVSGDDEVVATTVLEQFSPAQDRDNTHGIPVRAVKGKTFDRNHNRLGGTATPVRHEQARHKETETAINPRRSSDKLTLRGRTIHRCRSRSLNSSKLVVKNHFTKKAVFSKNEQPSSTQSETFFHS